MKTQLFVITALSSVMLSYAQDVKVKKNIITVDNKEIAKVAKEGVWYKISSLDDTDFVYVRTTNTTPNEFIASKYWLELKDKNEVITEFAFSDVPFSLSREKLAIQSFIKANTGILTESEFNKEAIGTVFADPNRDISTKHDLYRAEKLAINEAEDKLAEESKLSIKYTTNNVIIDGKGYGYFTKKIIEPSSIKLTIVDLSKREIGSITYHESYAMNKKFTVVTLDNKEFDLELIKKNFNDVDYNDIVKRTVHKLHAQGYDLSKIDDKLNEIKQQEVDAYLEKVEGVKNASINIYDVPGYLINKKGEKKEGNITIEFENLDTQTSSSGILSVGSYGTSGKIIYPNGKGEYFKAKDGVEFGYGDMKYIGLPTTEDSALSNGNSELDVFGGSTKFLKVEYENNGNYVLTHIKTPNDFYLKLDKEKKAIYLGNKALFGKRDDEKIKKIFDKYVACPSLDVIKYNTSTKDGLIQIITDFLATCK